MTREAFVALCESLPGAVCDQPFEGDFMTTVARHGCTRKWFAVLIEREGQSFANLKCEPVKGQLLRQAFTGIVPGYHMNKEHWISVYLASDVPEGLIAELVKDSYLLTKSKGHNQHRPKRI